MAAELVGAHPAVGRSPVLDAMLPVLSAIAEDAETIDFEGVERAHLRALAKAGYFRALAPGDGEAPVAVRRELVEQLAAASGSVWFVATQHRSPMEAVQTTANRALRDQWGSGLTTGDALGAVAFAHLRRPGVPVVRATADGDDWRISGTLDWITSWGIADVLMVMAETNDGRVVQVLIPAAETAGLRVTGPLPLAAMAATSTVGADLEDLRVAPEHVAHIVDKAEWLARDAERTANASPAVFGLLRAVLTELEHVGQRRAAPEAVALAHRWAERTREIRANAYAIMDGVSAGEKLEERVLLRAEALHLAQEATSALVATRGGKAMLLDSSAQRWAREALFSLVQAQTVSLRQNLLALYNRPD